MVSKMLIYRMTLFIIMIFCASCDDLSKEEKLAYKLINETFKYAEIKYGLTKGGLGESGNRNNLKLYEQIGLFFDSNHIIEKNEARKILIDILNTFIGKINSHDLNSIFSNWPITEKNIAITVFISLETEEDVKDISIFKSNEEGIFFKYRINSEGFNYIEVHESLDEARKLASIE